MCHMWFAVSLQLLQKVQPFLDDCHVVRHGSISCFDEDVEVFEFVINANICSVRLSFFKHSIETFLVGPSHNSSLLYSRNNLNHTTVVQETKVQI